MIRLGDKPFKVIDTAGIRRAPKVKESADFYSVLRAKGALAEADVALLLVDTVEGVAQQDQRIAEAAAESGAGLIVLLNKWDAADLEQRERVTADVADRLQFVGWAPLLRVSALTGARLHRLGGTVDRVLESREFRIPTGSLNRLIRGWQERHPAPARNGRRPHILYAVQAGTAPPTIILFVSGSEPGEDYLRYLENRLRKEFGFEGTPIKIFARRRKSRSG